MGGEHCKIFPLKVSSKELDPGQTPISAAVSEGCRSGRQDQNVCWHDSRERVRSSRGNKKKRC